MTEQPNPGPTQGDAQPSTGGRRSVLATRVRSAVLLGLPTLILGVAGGWWFSAYVLLVIGLASLEVIRLMQKSGFQPYPPFAMASAAVAFFAVRSPGPLVAPLASVVLLGSIAWQMRHRQGRPIADWAIAVAGGLYLGWCGGHLAAVRELPDGLGWLAFAVLLTWAADSGAYLVGSRFGRHRLAPRLSPGKSWEGYLGGIVVAVIGGGILGLCTPIGVASGVLAGGLIGALGTLGDLVESMFKRQADVKDSGNLIPGHGGVFDRIDSLLWAGVVTLYYATLIHPLLSP